MGIAEREYLRHESRRGRRHAFTHIDPVRTALVVIDMVPFFVEQNPYCRGIVSSISRLASSVRLAGGVVVWVVPTVAEATPAAIEFLGPQIAATYAASGGADAPRDRVWPGFVVEQHDLVVEKSAHSAFFPGRCSLPEDLTERGVDTVLVTGTVTNVCCESSARDASTLGFRVVMVADANAAGTDAQHNASLHTIYRTFGDVRSTEDVIGLVNNGRAP